MTNQNDSNFRSQRIVGKGAAIGMPPTLRASNGGGQLHTKNGTPNNIHHNHNNNSNIEIQTTIQDCGRSNSSSSAPWGWKIDVELIPQLPLYYLLDTMSVSLNDTPLNRASRRISEFLRLHSISYTYNAYFARLDCCTSNMLKFVIQFWLVQPSSTGADSSNSNSNNSAPAVTLELQRRQGSVMEMQNIRQKMFHVILTGEQKEPTTDWQRRQPLMIPDTVMSELDTHYDNREGRMDAVRICLQLMESSNLDQIKLGMESLQMLTDPLIVTLDDAVVISRDLLFCAETELGQRLQAALSLCFGISRSKMSDENDGTMMEYTRGFWESIHNIGLTILGQALQLVAEDDRYLSNAAEACTIDLATGFWGLVTQDILYNIERAVQSPNEGAISAKCMRLFSVIKGKLSNSTTPPTTKMVPGTAQVSWRMCLTRAHQHGRHCHLSLERESQQLLAMDIDQFIAVH